MDLQHSFAFVSWHEERSLVSGVMSERMSVINVLNVALRERQAIPTHSIPRTGEKGRAIVIAKIIEVDMIWNDSWSI